MTFIPTFTAAQPTALPFQGALPFNGGLPLQGVMQAQTAVPVQTAMQFQAPDASAYYMSRFQPHQPYCGTPNRPYCGGGVVPGLHHLIQKLLFCALGTFHHCHIGFPCAPFLQGYGAPGAGVGYTPLKPGDSMNWAGGTPFFDERTGQYRNPFMPGGNPFFGGGHYPLGMFNQNVARAAQHPKLPDDFPTQVARVAA